MSDRHCKHCGALPAERDPSRSSPQLRRYFAMIRATFLHWPETHPRQFGDEVECRKFLQMKAGHRVISSATDITGMSKDQVLLIAEAGIRAAEGYAVPVMHGNTLVIFKPKSIAEHKLDHVAFCRLNDEVEAVIFAETGIEAKTLLKETEAAA